MNKVKNYVRNATLMIALLVLPQTKALACMNVCFSGGECYEMEGDCSTVCAGENGFPTCSPAIAFNPNTGHIFTNAVGAAWILDGDIKIAIASDALVDFLKEMKEKYGTKIKDAKIQAKINAEFAKFKKTDNKIVSKERLAIISKESGLKIQNNEKMLKQRMK